MFLSSHKHFKKSFYTGRVDFTAKIIQERNEVIKEISVHQTKRHEHSTGQHPTAPAQAEPIWYKEHKKPAPEEIFGEQVVFLTSLLHELMQKKRPRRAPGMGCTDLQTDTATSATAGQEQEQKHPETAIPPLPRPGWDFILQPPPSNLSFLRAAAEQQTRQDFAVLRFSLEVWMSWIRLLCPESTSPSPSTYNDAGHQHSPTWAREWNW